MSGGEHEELALAPLAHGLSAPDELAALLGALRRERLEALAARLHRSLRKQYRSDLLEDALSMWTTELYRRLPAREPEQPVAEWLRMVWRATLMEACRTCRVELGGPVRQTCLDGVVIRAPLEAAHWVELPDPRLRHVRSLFARQPEAVADLLSEPKPHATSTARRQRAHRHAVIRADLAATLFAEDDGL